MKSKWLAVALLCTFSVAANAQLGSDTLTNQLRVQEDADRGEVLSLARLLGLPVRQVFGDGTVVELIKFRNGRPMYYATFNKNAAITTRTNWVHPGGGHGYALTGLGMTVGEWDAGSARSTHQEFGGRVTVMDGAASASHSTHVGGTLIASGVDAFAKGMAFQANLKSWDWGNDASEMSSAGLLFSNHSYGWLTGWSNQNGTWYWYGLQADSEDIGFGFYDESARNWDLIANGQTHYLIF